MTHHNINENCVYMCVDVYEKGRSMISHVKANAKLHPSLCLVNALPVALVQSLILSFLRLRLALGSGHKSQSRMKRPWWLQQTPRHLIHFYKSPPSGEIKGSSEPELSLWNVTLRQSPHARVRCHSALTGPQQLNITRSPRTLGNEDRASAFLNKYTETRPIHISNNSKH